MSVNSRRGESRFRGTRYPSATVVGIDGLSQMERQEKPQLAVAGRCPKVRHEVPTRIRMCRVAVALAVPNRSVGEERRCVTTADVVISHRSVS